MKKLSIFVIIFLALFLGCDNKSGIKEQDPSKQAIKQMESDSNTPTNLKSDTTEAQKRSFRPFYIYLDKSSRQNHYIPSGFMPDGKCVTLNDRWTEECYSGDSCIKIVYDVECSRDNSKWTGIYWLNPANNWGQRKGGFNLTGAQKLTFWAKGAIGGEQINEISVGGIMGDYPDSDKAVIGPIILLPVWKQYTIDLRGKDLSYISGGFSWSTSEEVNADKCIFYLDDIRFE